MELSVSSRAVHSLVSHFTTILSSQPHFVVGLSAFLAISAWFYLESGKRLPLSPPSLPIIGHLHLLSKLPHRSLYQLSQKYGPVFFIRLGSMPTVVVSSSALAKDFLHTHDAVFSDRPFMEMSKRIFYGGKASFLMDYGPRWREIRKLYTLEILSPKSIAVHKHVRNEEVSSALREIELQSCREDSVVELRNFVHNINVNIISRILFGKNYLEANGKISEFKSIVLEISEFFVLPLIGDVIPYLKWLDLPGYLKRMDRVFKRADALLEQVLSQRLLERQNQGPESASSTDLLDSLFDVNKNSQASDTPSVKALILELLVAGTETSSTTVEWAMAELLVNPRVMLKLQEELDSVVGVGRHVDECDFPRLKYLQGVIKETLRLHPPGPLLVPHLSKKACEVASYRLPNKTRLLVNVWAIGRDSKVWERPEEFLPERFIGSAVDALRATAFREGEARVSRD